MPKPLTHRPDVLVLAAGGTLGEAWMRGLLDGAGRATGIDFRDCEYFVGTSAGSIVAAFLAAGREPDSGPEARAAKEWGSKAGEANGAPEGIPLGAAADDAGERGPLASAVGRIGRTAAAPFAPARARGHRARRGRRASRGAGRRATRQALAGRAGAARRAVRGELRRAAADRRGRSAQRQARGVRRAWVAGCERRAGGAGLLLDPVGVQAGDDRRARVRRRRRVEPDGHLDATPARRGIEVLCLNPTAASRPLSSVSNAAALAESLALRARGARVRTLRPDQGAAEAMGHNLMDRSRVPEALAAGDAQGLALAA